MARKKTTRTKNSKRAGVLRFMQDSRYALGIILVLVVISYGNSVNNEFTYDDLPYIRDNKNITSLQYIDDIFTEPYPPHKPELGLYRPLVEVSYMLDYALGLRKTGLEPYGFQPEIDTTPFHITNILIHFAVCVLVFLIARRLFGKQGTVPFFAAALFAVHPVHVEVVASVVGRAESMATLFYVLALYCVVRSPLRGTYRSKWQVAAWILFLCALLSKEMAITLPVLIALYLLHYRSENIKEAGAPRNTFLFLVVYLLPYAAVFILYMIIRLNVVGSPGISESSQYFYGHPELPPTASMLVVFLGYIKLLVFPDVLHNDYNFPIPFVDKIQVPAPSGMLEPLPLLSFVILITLIAGGAYLLIRRRKPGFSILWILVTLFPVSNIIPFGDIMAERFLYLPSVGFCIAVAWMFSRFVTLPTGALPRLPTKTKIALALFAVIVVASTYRTIKRNIDWKNAIYLWRSVERIDPDNRDLYYGYAHAYENLRKYHLERGNVYKELGRTSLSREYLSRASEYEKLAIRYYYKCIEQRPDYYEAYHNLALLLKDAREPDLEEAARLEHFLVKNGMPQKWEHMALFNFTLGSIYAEMHDYEKTIRYYYRAIRFNPYKADYYINMGSAYAMIEKYSVAEKYWRHALRLDPTNQMAEKNLEKLRRMHQKGEI